MRRLIWLPVLALALFIVWLMISTPTRSEFWKLVYPRGAVAIAR